MNRRDGTPWDSTADDESRWICAPAWHALHDVGDDELHDGLAHDASEADDARGAQIAQVAWFGERALHALRDCHAALICAARDSDERSHQGVACSEQPKVVDDFVAQAQPVEASPLLGRPPDVVLRRCVAPSHVAPSHVASAHCAKLWRESAHRHGR